MSMGLALVWSKKTFCEVFSVDWFSSSSRWVEDECCWEGKRGTLNEPPGAAVCGTLAEVDRTPPVRRPLRREARGLGAGAVDITVQGDRWELLRGMTRIIAQKVNGEEAVIRCYGEDQFDNQDESGLSRLRLDLKEERWKLRRLSKEGGWVWS
jgi:hypothetical protein